MIHTIPHVVSEGLRRENEIHMRTVPRWTCEQIKARYPTAEAFFDKFINRVEGLQFMRAVEALERGASVLDIGAGHGATSIYLAYHGHRVTVVEPSLAMCRYTERAAEAYGLPLDFYHCPAEAIHHLPGRGFDACVFNASLHHCDEPVRALRNCHVVLAPGGKVFVLNEPQLQLFRSKAWFRRQLRQGTLVTGDYGGNEHTYYHHEYVAMLREAGFAAIQDELSLRYLMPDSYLKFLQARGAKGIRLRSRKLYYTLIKNVCRARVCGTPAVYALKRLSLLQTHFSATKLPAAT